MSLSLAAINKEPEVYLLPEYASDSEREELLADFFDMVFEWELIGWWGEQSDWPKNRDLNMFKQWFDVTFHSVVEDLVDEPLEDDSELLDEE